MSQIFPVKSFTQTACKEPTLSMRDTFVAPRMLPVCCACGLIRDDRAMSGSDRWITQQTYRKLYGINPSECLFTHTYCLQCFNEARHIFQQQSKEIGTTP
jgi:hypothetical protein